MRPRLERRRPPPRVGASRVAGALGVVPLTALVACAGPDPCREHELTPVDAPRMAVVLSDYASSALAIVQDDDTVVAPWLDSGSRPPALVAALSGDVVLPRAMPSAHELVLLDRYQTDVMTGLPYASPLDGLWQADLRGGRTSGSSPNPQDVIVWDESRWLVSRHNPAEDPAAPEIARGNDLAVLDVATHALVERIELGADRSVDGVHYFARPSGLAMLADRGAPRVLVGLARLSSLALRLTGPGAVVLVDPATRATSVLELPGLSNCVTVAALPGDSSRALVLCRGDAFGEDESRAGLSLVTVQDGALVEVARYMPDAPGAPPPPSHGLVALDDARVVYVSSGSVVTGALDRLVVLDLESGLAEVIAQSGPAPFELGEGALDRERGELLVPDGNARALRRFAVGVSLVEREPIDLSGACERLPPRQVVVLP